ncbi:MAG: hypothetical protein HZA22_03805 [Nitrospirae bacterium]|nr:hypothetical protein [Nitrospirota bacterium]MBI5696628.1 hypothetical protein [Nitrospirota bacterium]
MDCWDFMKCDPGANGGCPAYPEKGRECWKVTGTKCDGGKQEKASRVEKIVHCSKCGYYLEHAVRF